ncbi:MAG TPA: hypothetical protein DCY86_13845 [Bdellovibrionales bacterium]|nr:hypothetical protein [Bdellovibrionales bacterium]
MKYFTTFLFAAFVLAGTYVMSTESDVPKESEHIDHDEHENDEKHDEHAGEEKHGGHEKHDEHESGKAIGKGKAIEFYDEVKGLKLNPKALALLEIKTTPISEVKVFPESSLLSIKSGKSIFVLRDSHFLRLVLQSDGTIQALKTKRILMETDELVVAGVDILRASEVYATDKAEYGHGH